jgi:DNA-binding GntR family transcriptional regulator
VPAELEFHSAVWDASGNEWLAVSLRRVMVPYFTYSLALSMNRPDLSRELIHVQHTMYIDYLEGTIDRTAESCVRFHAGEVER